MDYAHFTGRCHLAPFIDWIELDPSCSRSVSRLVDLELDFEESLAAALQTQEAGK